MCQLIRGTVVCVFVQAQFNKDEVTLPWRHAGLELVRYGGVMLQLKSAHGYVLTFTPQSNEFTITLTSTAATGHTAGLCGSINTDSLDLDQSLLVPLINFYHNRNSVPYLSLLSVLKAPVGKIKQTSCLCVTALRPPTGRRLSRTGPWPRRALCACQGGGECVHPG